MISAVYITAEIFVNTCYHLFKTNRLCNLFVCSCIIYNLHFMKTTSVFLWVLLVYRSKADAEYYCVILLYDLNRHRPLHRHVVSYFRFIRRLLIWHQVLLKSFQQVSQVSNSRVKIHSGVFSTFFAVTHCTTVVYYQFKKTVVLFVWIFGRLELRK